MKIIKKVTIKYPCYNCVCGRKVVPMGNPSKCPHCGRVTILR